MSASTMSQFPIILLICILVVRFGHLIFQDQDSIGKSIVTKLMGSAALGVLASSTTFLPSTGWWLFILRVCAMVYSLLLAYLAIDQLLNNKAYQPMFTHKLFWGTTALLILGVLLDIGNRNYTLDASMGIVPFQPAWLFGITYALNYGIPWGLGVLIIWLYWRNLHYYFDLAYTVRRIMCMLGFLMGAFCIGSLCLFGAAINLFFLLVVGQPAGSLLNPICLSLRLVTFTSLVLGFILPQFVLSRWIRPLERYLARRKQRQDALLSYLHEQMIQLVPGVHLPQNELLHVRTPIEISDVRQIVWSHVPRTLPITPREEAEYLFALIHHQIVMEGPGKYMPPATRSPNVVKHNLAVAKHLKCLQGTTGAMTPVWEHVSV
jgi:hypothetical protein